MSEDDNKPNKDGLGAEEPHALHLAAMEGRLEEVHFLISLGHDVSERDDRNETPLSYALNDSHVDVIRALLAAGAEVDVLDEYSNTPLYSASRDGQLAVMKALIEAGADVNARCGSLGDTILYATASSGHLEALVLLLQSGAKPNSFDEDLGWTPLHVATSAERFDIMQALIEGGADVNANDESKVGETPLGAFARDCSVEVARLLIASGANPCIPGWMGITALERAGERKSPEGREVYQLLVAASRRFSQ